MPTHQTITRSLEEHKSTWKELKHSLTHRGKNQDYLNQLSLKSKIEDKIRSLADDEMHLIKKLHRSQLISHEAQQELKDIANCKKEIILSLK